MTRVSTVGDVMHIAVGKVIHDHRAIQRSLGRVSPLSVKNLDRGLELLLNRATRNQVHNNHQRREQSEQDDVQESYGRQESLHTLSILAQHQPLIATRPECGQGQEGHNRQEHP